MTQITPPTITPPASTPGLIPTERPPQPPVSPPPPGSSVTIWHSWGIGESDTLESIIDSFKRLYPDVDFQTQYIPDDELFKRYHDGAYLGGGPSIVIGSADWGAKFAQDGLVVDLKGYTSPEFLSTFNTPALASGYYHDQLISLPLSQDGVVIFRNQNLMSDPSATFDELIRSSRLATRAGNVGSYLERGAYISAPSIIGLGGQLMDEQNLPAFDTQDGLEWLDLLQAFDDAGAVTFNTNRDLEMFKRGRVGIIIDGTWNIPALIEAIGAENLAIDPWPAYGTGHMSGWVYVDSIYINSNLTGKDLTAALSFAGYLTDPNVQMRLAEIGHIPSVTATRPRDELIHQAMNTFSLGVPYPGEVDDTVLDTYWVELNKVISNVFEQGMDPAVALQEASDRITQIIQERNTTP